VHRPRWNGSNTFGEAPTPNVKTPSPWVTAPPPKLKGATLAVTLAPEQAKGATPRTNAPFTRQAGRSVRDEGGFTRHDRDFAGAVRHGFSDRLATFRDSAFLLVKGHVDEE